MGHSTPVNGHDASAVVPALAADAQNAWAFGLLLPCPFCGAPPNREIKRPSWADGHTFEIWCDCLRACVVEPTAEAAMRQWNQRRVGLISLSPALKKAVVAKWQRVKRRNPSKRR